LYGEPTRSCYDIDNPPPKQIGVECGRCNKHVSASITGAIVEDTDVDGGIYFEIILARCPACRRAVLVGRTVESLGADEFELYTPRRLSPSDSNALGRRPRGHPA